MFHFPGFAPRTHFTYDFYLFSILILILAPLPFHFHLSHVKWVRGTWTLLQVGSPIRKSPDHSLLGGSPRLFAAYHVLPRLLAPRHPPIALSILTLCALISPIYTYITLSMNL